MLAQALGITFAIFLFILCAMLLVLEIFVPSLGLLTAMALLCLAAGIALFFQVSAAVGWAGVWTAVVLIPAVWVIVYRFFPKTKLGSAFLLKKVERSLGDAIPDYKLIQSLEGCEGVVVSPLRPVGICKIKSQRVTCISETEFLNKNEHVKVIKVEGNKIIVRKI